LTDLLRPLAALTKLTPEQAVDAGKLESLLRALPDGATLGAVVDEVKAEGLSLAERTRKDRETNFRRIEADYVNQAKASGHSVRELDTGWRIGLLELHVDRGQGRLRLLYNRELLQDWTAVGSLASFEKSVSIATDRLRKAEIPDDLLRRVFWNAYQESKKRGSSDRVPLRDLYRELRLELVRSELEGGRTERKLTFAEFPKWAFLYNLDRYRHQSASIPQEMRLALETGSQVDHTKGLSMVVGGLDPREPYKTYCYVHALGGRAQ
jgi:hypothetical protein